jgi:hypothetical protein
VGLGVEEEAVLLVLAGLEGEAGARGGGGVRVGGGE